MQECVYRLVEYGIANYNSVIKDWVICMSIVVFLMGLLKTSRLFNKIKNSLVRKLLLAWGSTLLSGIVTAVILLCTKTSLSGFWGSFLINTVGTIITYWLYENTALRDTFSLVINKIFKSKLTVEDIIEVKSAQDKTKKSKYNEDDLKNL